MFTLLREAAGLLRKYQDEEVAVVSHVDADGIAAASIVSQALDREGIHHSVTCVKLDEIPDAAATPADLTIFADLGSGQLPHLPKGPIIILDHHPPLEYRLPQAIHVNPTFYGYDGSSEISGAGISYLFATTLNPENVDLSPLAVVGACGDMQDFGKLTGLNRDILEAGERHHLVSCEDDLLLYGRYTRPLFKSLQYFSDPFIPGITGDEGACKQLLEELVIASEENWVTLSQLTFEQKRVLASELVMRSLKYAPPDLGKYIPQLIIGESYSLLREEEMSPLRDSREFSTCLNASGRRGRYDVGVEVAKGNRGIYYDMLMSLLQEHRSSIAKALESLTGREVRRVGRIQVLDAEGVSDTIVGTVAQMLLGQNGVDPYVPLLVYTPSEKDERVFKVSVRCSRLLLYRHVHLGNAVRRAAALCGGEGGGHAPACGAYVPEEKLHAFVDHFAGLMEMQLK